jgi:LCP family protein required for cell wall assembly
MRTRRPASPRLLVALAALVASAVAGTTGIVRATDARLGTIRRDAIVTPALAEPGAGFENYLLVGSDSREGIDPSDPDYAAIGADEVSGRRGDTIILFHYDVATGAGALLSFPRDLWVRVGGGEERGRINTAYQAGPDVLVRTLAAEWGIPVHHYLEVNFVGFKRLVDAVGGVRICVPHRARDRKTGLFIPPGCSTLDGIEALAFARSRYYEEQVDGEWRMDGSSDIGRGRRQREFVAAMLASTLSRVTSDPLAAGRVFEGAISAVSVDERLDLTAFAKKLRPAATGDVRRYQLETYGDTVGDASVLRVAEASAPVLAFFAGTGPAPEPTP